MFKLYTLISAVFLSVLLVSPAAASDQIVLGDGLAGRSKAEPCFRCHGQNGISQQADIPMLAGQHPEYLVKQIIDFRSGLRVNHEKETIVHALNSRTDIKDVAAYFASQYRPVSELKVNHRLASMGQQIFNEIYKCNLCHGERGKGTGKPDKNIPVIIGERKDNIVRMLLDYRYDIRINDSYGMMIKITKKMTDEELIAVAFYLGS